MEPNIIAFSNETMQFRLSIDNSVQHVSLNAAVFRFKTNWLK